ncbi:coiled-coil domain-containing protein [Faecalibacter bovis]|uniref:WIF domain-containing protein n=1 Tax=Faecalibacter bovis TaxID=2898187 RepID=A0ABX7XHF9_9FLAO|nr:hypothetical protein [Faecalibacter bovis]MBS7332040.1 hypothetical protein [Weeksellaceae bacterium]QTV06949.1 hypothetical protein J9309_06485 [Faecalibacter bovis]
MKTKEYTNLETKPTFSKNIIILLLSIALLGTIGYILYEKKRHDRELGSGADTIDDLERSREVLKQELRIARAEYDTAKVAIVNKDADMQEKDRQIFEKQKQIQNILNNEEISKEDIRKAKRLIASLKTELGEYRKQIEVLTQQNKRLQSKNEELTNQNELVVEKNKAIEEDLSTVTKEKEAQRANVNSTLAISNYTLTGLRVKSSGKEIETEKASRINKLRVTFEVDPNQNAVQENKELFIAIYKPDGELGRFEGANSGNIPLRSGKTVDYSDRVVFKFDPKNGNKINFDWKDYNFPKGEYKIDIYQNGFKIAQNKISLK